MASAIEVYRGVMDGRCSPFAEDDLNVMGQVIDTRYPWHDPKRAAQSYIAGKLQAEAYLYRDGSLPLVTVRIGHVLSGPDDFTGRLAHYVDMVRLGSPLRYANAAAGTSFLTAQQIAEFLAWAGMQDFTGPINAASGGPISAFDLYHRVAMVLEAGANALPATLPAAPGVLSPFDYPQPFAMDTSRAASLGFRFGHHDEWLDDTIRQHDLAFV